MASVAYDYPLHDLAVLRVSDARICQDGNWPESPRKGASVKTGVLSRGLGNVRRQKAVSIVDASDTEILIRSGDREPIAQGWSGSGLFVGDDLVGILTSTSDDGLGRVLPVLYIEGFTRNVFADESVGPGFSSRTSERSPAGPELSDSFAVKVFAFSDVYPLNGFAWYSSSPSSPCECSDSGALGIIAAVERTRPAGFGVRAAVSTATTSELRYLDEGVRRRYVRDTLTSLSATRLLYSKPRYALSAFAGVSWVYTSVEIYTQTSTTTVDLEALDQHYIGGLIGGDLSVRISSRLRLSTTIEFNGIQRREFSTFNTRIGAGLGFAFW